MKQGISLPQIPKNLQTDNKELYDYLFGLQQALLAKQTDDYSAVDKTSTDIASGSVPIGTILMYAVATAPTNYLICDGSAISRTTYAGLFSVIGTAYGTGDGSTTFNLPNYQAVVPKGVGTQTINTRVKTAPAFAAVEEDRSEVHRHALAGGTSSGSFAALGGQTTRTLAGVTTAFTQYYETLGGGVVVVMSDPVYEGVSNRTGTTTRENSIGTNFIIRYQ